MKITDKIETGKVYYWKRSNGWDWFGEPRWWELFVEFTGFNGSGGVWINKFSKWNSAPEGKWQFPAEIKSLSWKESQRLISEVIEQTQNPKRSGM